MRILTDTPRPVTELRNAVPPHVADALAKALEKLPADRFENAKAFAAALGDPGFSHATRLTAARPSRATASTRSRPLLAMTAVAAVLAVLLAKEWLTQTPANDAAAVVRFPLAGDPSIEVITGATRPFAISPDGRTIVFRGSTDSIGPHLWVRTIDNPVPRMLEGTADAFNPAISPDGQTVAFLIQNKSLRTVPIAGGAARDIASLPSISAALSWASNDEILFESISPDGGISRVKATGGTPELAVPIDSAGGEIQQRRPLMLRDAGIIVYGSWRRSHDFMQIALYRPSDKRRVHTGLDGISALALIDGHLIYSGALGELLAVKFDAKAMKVTGPPVALNPRVAYFSTGTAVALSERGTLVYRTEWASTQARLDLVDTTGRVRSIPGTFNVNGTPRFSPNGRSVVLGLGTQGVFGRRMGVSFTDLWEVDIATGEPTRLTSGVEATAPLWSADGTRVFYQTEITGKPQQWMVPVNGSAPPSRAFDYGVVPFSASATPDGKSIITATGSSNALLRGWLDGSGRVDTLVTRAKDGVRPMDPRVSPDGRWVAFVDRSPSDVWIRALSGTTLLQVSTRQTDGNPVAWSPDSRRLYYATTEGLHAIELETTPALRVAKRRVIGRFPAVTDYDLAPDGHTFVVVNPIRSASDVVVVLNWGEEARRAWSGVGK